MPQLEIDPVTQAVRVVMPEPEKGRGNPLWNHVTHSWDYPKPAADHPEAVDLHHHMRASDDGMPLPKEPEDHQAQGHVEQRPISPSATEVEAYRAQHDRMMADLDKLRPGTPEYAAHVASLANPPPISTQQLWALATGGWDLREFQRRNLRRSEAVNGFNHHLNDWTLGEWLLATFGELGEAANIEKKMLRIRTRARGNDRKGGNPVTMTELRTKFRKEIADAFIYLLLTAARAEFDLADAVEEKYAEVSDEIGYLEPPRVPVEQRHTYVVDEPPRGYKDDTAKEATMRFANGVADSLK